MYYTITPAGSTAGPLESTAEKAIKQILVDAAHMPYRNWGDFLDRGYTIAYLDESQSQASEVDTEKYRTLKLANTAS